MKNIIDIKKDTNFKYIFGRHDTDSIKALSLLLNAYLEVPVENLVIKSPEIVLGTEYTKNIRLDIYCTFGEGEKVDVEMQTIHRKDEMEPRMILYLNNLSSQQVKEGENYTEYKDVYVIFFMDFIKYEDDELVHRFTLRSEKGLKYGKRDYITLITVELPKVKEDPQTTQEKWAYALKYCGNLRKRDKIEAIKKELEGVDLVMRIAQSISKDEQEWLKEFDELRNKLDEGERVLQAEKRGINIGINQGIDIGINQGIDIGINSRNIELIHRNYSLGRTIEEIAEILGVSKSEVETILKLKP